MIKNKFYFSYKKIKRKRRNFVEHFAEIYNLLIYKLHK